MCRIFGFRSVVSSGAHASLLKAENALIKLSKKNPDGWGLAYFEHGKPELQKACKSALSDKRFNQISDFLTSKTVLAHIRKATTGSLSIQNTQPFRDKTWVFAHNGNIEDFDRYHVKLHEALKPKWRSLIKGQTDSELIFYLILQFLEKHHNNLKKACQQAIHKIESIVGKHEVVDGPPDQTYLTFSLTDGSQMIAYQGGKSLYYSTYKTKCNLSSSCTFYAPSCESPTEKGKVNHLLISSEPIGKENIWLDLQPKEFVFIDDDLNFEKGFFT